MQKPTTPGATEHGERRYLLAPEIATDDAFQFRQTGTQKAHVRSLVQTLRTVGDLDPVLIWEETDADGTPTGRLVLLDGQHRLAAYATAKGPREGIPAVVVKGDRGAAMLAAVKANSRESLPLTKNERMDAAWRLVRLPGRRLKVREVAGASGAAPRTVDMMRKRWAAMVAEEKQPTGQWWRDRQDEPLQTKDTQEMTNKERQALVEQLSEAFRKALGKMPWQDEQITAEAIERAVGTCKLRSMTEYLFTDDEFADEFREAMEEPEGDARTADF